MSLTIVNPVVTLPEQAIDPAALTDQVSVYAKDVGGVSQTFARSDDGTVYQLTPPNDPAFLSQATWFIDAITGDDSNTGETALTALKTWAEWDRRIGDGLITIAMNIFVNSDLNEPGYPIRATLGGFGFSGTPPGGFVFFQGTRTVIHASGVISAIQNYDFTLSPIRDGQLTDNTLSGTSWSDSGPGGSSLVKKMMVLTSGADIGKVAWVIKDLGAKRARFSVWFDPLTFAQGAPADGDTFDVVELTELAGGPVRFLGNAIGGSQGAFIADFRILGDGPGLFNNCIEASNAWAACTCDLAGRVLSAVSAGASFIGACLHDGDENFLVTESFVGVAGCAIFGRLRSSGRSASVSVLANTVAQVLGQANPVALEAEAAGEVAVNPGQTYAVFDESRATGGAMTIGTGCLGLLRGRIATLNPAATAGFGLWIDAGGQVAWDPVGDTATAHMTFDATTVAVEIGGTTFSVAAVGTGKSNTGKLAMAVSRKRLPP